MASSGINRSLYFYKGASINLNEQEITQHCCIDIRPDQPIVLKNGAEESYLLLLQGRPINEPVVQYGPFVMNSDAEIREAMNDYHQTQFGGWPWPSYDRVHPREKGRFAIHADGWEEVKNS